MAYIDPNQLEGCKENASEVSRELSDNDLFELRADIWLKFGQYDVYGTPQVFTKEPDNHP